MSKPIITFENVTKRFGRMVAVDNVSLTIDEGEFFCLLGPSGCGKSTLIRLLLGLRLAKCIKNSAHGLFFFCSVRLGALNSGEA